MKCGHQPRKNYTLTVRLFYSYPSYLESVYLCSGFQYFRKTCLCEIVPVSDLLMWAASFHKLGSWTEERELPEHSISLLLLSTVAFLP